MLMTFANGISSLCPPAFTSIGKARLGVIMSPHKTGALPATDRHFPDFLRIDGIMYAGPITSYTSAFVSAVVFARRELEPRKLLNKTPDTRKNPACRILRLHGSLHRHYSSPSQCDPARRAFML